MLLVNDRALLDGYRRCDAEALEAVFAHYAPRVAKWVSVGFSYRSEGGERRFRGFRSPSDLHDAVHEVFRAVFEDSARKGYSGLAPFEGYLFIITKNVVMKRLGARGADPGDSQLELESLPSEELSPEDIVSREEEKSLVRAFLDTLTDDERNFVDLRFAEQLSQIAVGARLGWSRKKVRIQEESIRRGLTRFFKRLRGHAEVREVLHDVAR